MTRPLTTTTTTTTTNTREDALNDPAPTKTRFMAANKRKRISNPTSRPPPLLLNLDDDEANDENTSTSRPPSTHARAEISRVLPSLYIGSAAAAADAPLLSSIGITHVLNCCTLPNPPASRDLALMQLHLTDTTADLPRLSNALSRGVAFIQRALAEGGRVLVHCHRGISRSCSLVAGYIISTHHISSELALELIRRHHPPCDPNLTYLVSLQEWERSTSKTRRSNLSRVFDPRRMSGGSPVLSARGSPHSPHSGVESSVWRSTSMQSHLGHSSLTPVSPVMSHVLPLHPNAASDLLVALPPASFRDRSPLVPSAAVGSPITTVATECVAPTTHDKKKAADVHIKLAPLSPDSPLRFRFDG